MVEQEIDRLYGLPLEEFVSERNRAAREAKKGGRPEDGRRLAALPKPTVAAWTVNQLARTQRKDVDLLLDSGHRLVEAQRLTLAEGGQAELAKARAGLEKAIGRLVQGAERVLGDRATDATLGRVRETLRSSAISPESRELLARGALTKETSTTGWDVLTSLAADVPPGPRPVPAGRPVKARNREPAARAPEQTETAAKRRSRLRAEQRRAASESSARARDVQAAERARAAAERALAEADDDLEAARRRLAQAEERLAGAERAVREADR